jgi:hypothetical protein
MQMQGIMLLISKDMVGQLNTLIRYKEAIL